VGVVALSVGGFGASVSVEKEEGASSEVSKLVEVKEISGEDLKEASSLKSTLSEVSLKGVGPLKSNEKLDTSDSFGVGYVLPHHLAPYAKYAYGHPYPYAPLPHHPPLEQMIHGRHLEEMLHGNRHLVLKHPHGPLHAPVYTVVEYVPGFHYNYRNHGFNAGYGHGSAFGHFMNHFPHH